MSAAGDENPNLTTTGESVYAYFGNVGVFALDLDTDGTVRWSYAIEASDTRLGWGTAAFSGPVS